MVFIGIFVFIALELLFTIMITDNDKQSTR